MGRQNSAQVVFLGIRISESLQSRSKCFILKLLKLPDNLEWICRITKMALQWLSCHFWHAPFCVSCLIHRLFPLLSFARVHKLLINSHSNSAHLVAGPSASLDHQQGCQLAARRSSSASSLPHRANSDATISIPRC